MLTPRTHGQFRLAPDGVVYDAFDEPCGSIAPLADGRWVAYRATLDENAIGIYAAPGQAFRALAIYLGE